MGIGESVIQATSGADLSWPIRRSSELFGENIAYIDGEESLTYRQLWETIQQLTAGLEACGVERGGRVGFIGVNSMAHVLCVIGVPIAGRVLVDLNFRLAPAELEFIVGDCEVEILITDRDQLDVARRVKAETPSIRQLVLDAPGECPPDCIPFSQLLVKPGIEPPTLDSSELATISYTGGSTGQPKGVMLTHGNLIANALNNLIAAGHHEQLRWLHVSSMFHVAGTSNIFACSWVGATQIILPRFDPVLVADTIESESITHTTLVPTMLQALLDELDKNPRDISSLVHLQYAASPIPPVVQRRALERFSGEVVQFYGMTEAAPTVTGLTDHDHRIGLEGPPEVKARLRSIGRPVIGVEAEVRDVTGKRLGVDEVGELWIRGANVMAGYWNRPDVTAGALVDGWYRSGDAARMDSAGYLFLVDRLKDMIISGGENVYSIEVEAALTEHPAVAEAAVFGIPDPQWGEAVHAAIYVDPGKQVTPEELIAHCRERIAGYKIPKSFELRDEPLPKSGPGKLMKKVLREPYWEGHDRRIN